jgi:hypothetical protein
MADMLFANNASALLAASINDTDTTIQVASGYGALFPSPSGTQYFLLTLEDNSGNIEVVKITGRTGDNLTMDSAADRGQEGTTAQSFTLTVTRCELRNTAAVLQEMVQVNGDTMAGDLDMNGNNLVDAVLTGASTSVQGGECATGVYRGATGVTGNQLAIPADGVSRATLGGADILVDTDAVVSQATESSRGTAELATQAEMDAQTDDLRIVTPLKFKNTAASETVYGTLLLATEAEVTIDTPVVADKAVTPATLAARTATETRAGLVEKATQAEVDAGADTDRYVTPATLEAKASAGLATFTGTSTITGLTTGKKYLVSVYGIARDASTGTATLGSVRVGDGASLGAGTQLASTGSQSINWPDGNCPQSATMVITAASANINGTVDYISSGTYVAAKYMCAVQLD